MSDDYGECCAVERYGHAPDFEKDPNSRTDFAFDWSADLEGDTLETSEFLLPDGLTQESVFLEDTRTAIFVSGGSAGSVYRITNRVTTSGGRAWDKTIYVKVTEQ
jgi:hypothetical protein